MKWFLVFIIIFVFSCMPVHENTAFYAAYIDNMYIEHDDFMLGWYINNDSRMLEFAMDINNPYASYYNTYIVYSHNRYNKQNDLLILSPGKIHSYAGTYPDKVFIADLPRYSTLYRNIEIPANKEPQAFSHPYIETYIMDNSYKRIDYPYAPEVYRTENDSTLYVYDFKNAYPYYGVMHMTDEFFAGKANASVYRYSHILDFASKSLDGNASLCIIINISSEISDFTIAVTDNFKLAETFAKSADLIIDTLIQLNKISRWHVSTINIGDLMESEYVIRDMTVISDNTLLGPFVFKYSFDYASDVCRYFIDSLSGITNVIGFYPIDEIQYKEMLCLDRWADKSLTEKESYSVLELVENIEQYAQKNGKLVFALSSAGFHDITGFAMNQSEYNNINKYVRIFDTYSYRDDYVNALLSAVKNRSGLLNIIVNDAYSAHTRKALPFYLTKFKFFLPLIAGIDGMLFYTYSSPKVYSISELQNDTSKINVGELSEYAHGYNIFDMYSYSRHFIMNDKNRMSAVMNNENMILFFFAAIEGHENYYNPSGSAVHYDFTESDVDIEYIRSLLDTGNYLIMDISPYSLDRYIASDTFAFLSTYISSPMESFADMIDQYPFNTLFHIYDIRIIAIMKTEDYSDLMLYGENNDIRFPQLIMPGSVIYEGNMINIKRKLSYLNCLDYADFVITLPLDKNSNDKLLFRDFSDRPYSR